MSDLKLYVGAIVTHRQGINSLSSASWTARSEDEARGAMIGKLIADASDTIIAAISVAVVPDEQIALVSAPVAAREVA